MEKNMEITIIVAQSAPRHAQPAISEDIYRALCHGQARKRVRHWHDKFARKVLSPIGVI